jgi:hypothetical protein
MIFGLDARPQLLGFLATMLLMALQRHLSGVVHPTQSRHWRIGPSACLVPERNLLSSAGDAVPVTRLQDEYARARGVIP